jgi:hypothetical protein
MNGARHLLLGLLTALACGFLDPCFAQQNLAGQVLQNESGHDFGVQGLVDSHGEKFAELYIATGHKMGWDSNGDVFYGAGYYLAVPGNYYFSVTSGKSRSWPGGIGGLHINKIAWDDKGRTTEIVGLSPFFEGAHGNIKIVTDVSHPKVENGILILKFSEFGGRTFKFDFKFGQIVSITPA